MKNLIKIKGDASYRKFFRKKKNGYSSIVVFAKKEKIKNFKNKKYKIPKYTNDILIKEANLFCEWYVKKNLLKNTKEEFSIMFKIIIIK